MNETTVLAAPPDLLEVAVAEPAARVTYRFQFQGNGAEYFRIWIVNLLLTIVTLGVFSAWAKVRRLRYFYGNTLLDGHSFEYHARPLAILKGRLVVFAGYVLFVAGMQFYQKLLFALVPIAILGIPWVMLRARRFQMRMSSWRNVRFGFEGRFGGALSAYMGWYLLLAGAAALVAVIQPNQRFMFIIFLCVALGYPFWVHKRVEYSLDNSYYGRQSFGFFTRAGRFYVFCIATAVFSVIAWLAFAYLFFRLPGMQEPLLPGQTLEGLDLLMRAGPKGWLLLLLGAVVGFSIYGFYKSQLINASFNGLGLGANSVHCSLKVSGLAWIHVTNLLGILGTLGIFYPWAKVRLARYQLEHMHIDSDGRLAEFLNDAYPQTSALGEEAGDFFDVDLGM
jgi:uncharacterized membrane protein YjgN (DUF898 family)